MNVFVFDDEPRTTYPVAGGQTDQEDILFEGTQQEQQDIEQLPIEQATLNTIQNEQPNRGPTFNMLTSAQQRRILNMGQRRWYTQFQRENNMRPNETTDQFVARAARYIRNRTLSR